MKRLISINLTLTLLFFSCGDKEFDNNYDPNTTELPQPYSLNIEQIEDGVYLEWSNSDSNIDSYLLEKQEEGSTWIKLTEIYDYSTKNYTDSDIKPGATYNYRVSIKAGQNQSDYDIESITIKLVSPTIITVSAEAISESEIRCVCKIDESGGGGITSRGIYWNTVSDSYGTKVTSTETGSTYSVDVKDLLYGVKYYITSFASNNEEVGYGNQITIKITINDITGETGVLTDIDGNIYKWIGIGRKAWMAENLKVTHSPNGANINYSYYDNSIENRDTYGALYNNVAAENACPIGWHLSRASEWQELERFISDDGHNGIEGIALKSTYGWANDGNGTDIYGFNALPGGANYEGNSFQKIGINGYWWTSTFYEYFNFYDRSYYLFMSNDESEVTLYGSFNENEFSIRCIRD
jgi:uncharacterized protein (TIGR02145 family)